MVCFGCTFSLHLQPLSLHLPPLFLCIHIEYLGKLELSRISITTPENTLSFVNIIRRKNANFDLALRKRLFCNEIR